MLRKYLTISIVMLLIGCTESDSSNNSRFHPQYTNLDGYPKEFIGRYPPPIQPRIGSSEYSTGDNVATYYNGYECKGKVKSRYIHSPACGTETYPVTQYIIDAVCDANYPNIHTEIRVCGEDTLRSIGAYTFGN